MALDQALLPLLLLMIGGIGTFAVVEYRRLRGRIHDLENWCAATITWLRVTFPDQQQDIPKLPRAQE